MFEIWTFKNRTVCGVLHLDKSVLFSDDFCTCNVSTELNYQVQKKNYQVQFASSEDDMFPAFLHLGAEKGIGLVHLTKTVQHLGQF